MPGAVAAAIGAIASTAVAAASGTLIGAATLGFAGALAATFAVNFGVSLVLGFVGSALLGKPKMAEAAAAQGPRQQGLMTVVRGSAEPRRAAYGRIVASGVLVFQASSGSDNKFRHLVIAVADHPIDGVEGFYFNQTFIPVADLDGSGNVTAGTYANKARIQWKLGAEDQAAFPDLAAEVAEWTAEHRCRGVFLVYLRLEFDRNVYPTGIPNPRVLFRGRKLWDPRAATVALASSTAAEPAVFTTAAAHGLAAGDRVFIRDHVGAKTTTAQRAIAVEGEHRVTATPTATTFRCAKAGHLAEVALATPGSGGTLAPMRWSHNAALAQADYFLAPVFGLNGRLDEINVTELIGDANVCDEAVGAALARGFTADPATDALALDGATSWTTASSVYVRSAGTLPAPLVAGTEYFWIRSSATAGKLAASEADARAGTAIDLTDTGSGAHSAERAATFTADPTTDIITPAKFAALPGDKVTVASTGTPPAPLAAGTNYWWIGAGPLAGQVAASYANALQGIAIDLTSAGSGVHTVVRQEQPRYTLDGVVEFGRGHGDIMTDLMTASGGACVYVQGQHQFRAAAYRASVMTLADGNLRGAPEIDPGPGRADAFNRVVGMFVDAADRWQETDFPPQTNAQWIADDGGEVVDRDLRFPYTVDSLMAQRLARIFAQRSRQPIRLRLPCNLSALRLACLDTVAVTLPEIGWTAKEFLVTKWNFGRDAVGVDLELWEEAADSYAFAPGVDAVWVDPAPNTMLASPFDPPPAPTDFAVASGTAVLGVRLDGTVFSRARLTWTAPASAFVTSGGRIEIEHKKSASGTWRPAQFVDGAATEAFILDLDDGAAYDFRVRAVAHPFGVVSDWATVADHVVVGKSALPSNVSGFSAQQNGPLVVFRWNKIADLDRAGYVLKYATVPFVWEDALLLKEEESGTGLTEASLPPGDWVVGIKARDTSNNESATATTIAITVVNKFNVVATSASAGTWTGVRSGLFRHDVSGTLVPQSNTLAAAMTDAQLWNQMCYDPVSSPYYEAAELDVGFDADGVRVWADTEVRLGAGESGTAKARLEIDFRDEAASYDGFETWTIGTAHFRRLKARAVLETSDGAEVLARFDANADVEDRVESFKNVAVAAGGTAIAFADRFHSAPSVQVTAMGANPLVYPPTTTLVGLAGNISGTGCIVHIFNKSDADVGGTANVDARGA